MNGENVKITKRSHAYKCYASNYRVEILNSLNPELNFSNIYSNSIAEAIITESHIDHAFESIYITIIANIQKPL